MQYNASYLHSSESITHKQQNNSNNKIFIFIVIVPLMLGCVYVAYKEIKFIDEKEKREKAQLQAYRKIKRNKSVKIQDPQPLQQKEAQILTDTTPLNQQINNHEKIIKEEHKKIKPSEELKNMIFHKQEYIKELKMDPDALDWEGSNFEKTHELLLQLHTLTEYTKKVAILIDKQGFIKNCFVTSFYLPHSPDISEANYKQQKFEMRKNKTDTIIIDLIDNNKTPEDTQKFIQQYIDKTVQEIKDLEDEIKMIKNQ